MEIKVRAEDGRFGVVTLEDIDPGSSVTADDIKELKEFKVGDRVMVLIGVSYHGGKHLKCTHAVGVIATFASPDAHIEPQNAVLSDPSGWSRIVDVSCPATDKKAEPREFFAACLAYLARRIPLTKQE